ncbi:phenylacetate--CoA ligase family protein [Streptomyces sp. NPDC086091]|uniref:phenylacetate--CoA ligase family protein n=1 Tax=Streptomyces sp. NPDC086091 TaxID=3365751 RepID=UPI003813A131
MEMTGQERDDAARWNAFAREVARSVPAYARHLRRHGIDPRAVGEVGLDRLPRLDKQSYIQAYPLVERCRDTDGPRMIATSSGSSGSPTIWPRALDREATDAVPFDRILNGTFRARERHTLAVVCFPLGNWIGGVYTLGCLQHLARHGARLTIATPGNNVGEILRVVEEVGPSAEQTVLLGYPPFVKDVIDAGRTRGIAWERLSPRLVLAGEVFSETWRDLVCARAGITDPETSTAAVYGTSDAGVLAFETPATIGLRRAVAATPGASERVFASERLPMLMRFDPALRHFEAHEGRLFLTTDGAVPLVRYTLGDSGGVLDADALEAHRLAAGLTAPDHDRLPAVWLFGRDLFALSLYGANVYPETIALGLEAPAVRDHVTGKFVMEVEEGEQPRLRVVVEYAPRTVGHPLDPAAVADSLLSALHTHNSEYVHYVPAPVLTPTVELRPHADPAYFPAGVKHRYTRTAR